MFGNFVPLSLFLLTTLSHFNLTCVLSVQVHSFSSLCRDRTNFVLLYLTLFPILAMSFLQIIFLGAIVSMSTAAPLFGSLIPLTSSQVQYVTAQPASAAGTAQPATSPLGLPPFFNALLTAPNQVLSQMTASISPTGGAAGADPLSRLFGTPVSFAQSALGQMNGMFGPEGHSPFLPDLSQLATHPVANMTGTVFQQISTIPAGLLQQIPFGLQPQQFGLFGQQQQQTQLPFMLPSFPGGLNLLQPYPSAVPTSVASAVTPAVVAAPAPVAVASAPVAALVPAPVVSTAPTTTVTTTTVPTPASVAETSGEVEATNTPE